MIDTLELAAAFLLKHPPLEEIGGLISDIVEEHRFGVTSEQEAIQEMIKDFSPYLKQFCEDNAFLNELCLETV